MATVIADGFGHGLIRIGGALNEAKGFGVASLGEALVLRDPGIAQRILLLEGFFSPGELAPFGDTIWMWFYITSGRFRKQWLSMPEPSAYEKVCRVAQRVIFVVDIE